MRRRRRTSRGTWLPTLGTGVDVDGFDYSGRGFFLTVPENGGCTVLITPLTFDHPIEGETVDDTKTALGSIIGNEYVLNRIVGKFICYRNPETTIFGTGPTRTDAYSATQVGAGFFVARAQDDDTGDADQPIGSNTAAERNDNYNPLDVDCIREPWIWRRTWMLGSQNYPLIQTGTINHNLFRSANNLFPVSNVNYGSVLDGPHIDSKVKRRVRLDERLFFVIAVRNAFGISDVGAPGVVDVQPVVIGADLDYRIFGSLRKAHNKSSF